MHLEDAIGEDSFDDFKKETNHAATATVIEGPNDLDLGRGDKSGKLTLTLGDDAVALTQGRMDRRYGSVQRRRVTSRSSAASR